MAINRPPNSSLPARALLEKASLTDLEAMRLLLRGQSVIDWHRLAFRDVKEVERFLRVNEFDPDSTDDLNRLEELRDEAVDYLQRNFSYHIPPEVSSGIPVADLFLLASQRGRRQTYACVVLKAMHVIHHLAGRELLFKLPISDDQVFGYVEKKVLRTVEEIRAAGLPIVEFAWSRKERDSLITKLLAKKASIAANVYDKLRFRLITRTREDLSAVLMELTHRLVPFNYVIPGESVNNILDLRRIIDETPPLQPVMAEMQGELEVEPERAPATSVGNEFSGPAYRVVNFVTDLPVRIDDYLDEHLVDDTVRNELGSIIFVLTEFQILDAETAATNEMGENSHAAYKERQAARVKSRLTGGSRATHSRDEPDSD